ncbi:MAG: hypothetical protein M1826_003724 [Phylliscum demangeonii]|nr:MAG: hypothetical protein M1826_003724 [Phylliscum demangeonii]
MAPRPEKSQLKRVHVTEPEVEPEVEPEGRMGNGRHNAEVKKPRRSQRLQSQSDALAEPAVNNTYLPSPLTHQVSTVTEGWKEATATPPPGRPSQPQRKSPPISPRPQGLSSTQGETQALSQFIYPASDFSHEVEDEEAEGVWGYLIPLAGRRRKTVVLRKRSACEAPTSVRGNKGAGKGKSRKSPIKDAGDVYVNEEEFFELEKQEGTPSEGYIIGRHPECDIVLKLPTISNRHFLLFPENSHGNRVALLEDLSSNGTFVNDAVVGRNNRRELKDGDQISILDATRFAFRYPRHKRTSGFRHQYTLLQELGHGHFATVSLCVEKATGERYAVKVFSRRPAVDERTKTEGLQQEIAVLMAVSHPNLLCLKDTFDEEDGVFIVLELAPEGELFNLIVLKSKLTEAETRKIFIQLFQGVKYLHTRNIVHRDIKPENILLADQNLHVKIADFGLAKIVGEESFTTSLCGTPSYVAPEILEDSKHRKYTRAVDVWSLGVVLYICLCGFPPFSDELKTKENPYTLSDQIRFGHYEFPSPYWDAIGDPALDLIERMLMVDVNERITVDECLEHPWITQPTAGPNDSTGGLTGAMGQLDFSKRRVERERTLLSTMNDVKVNQVISGKPDQSPVKVFEKNPGKPAQNGAAGGKHRTPKEAAPTAQRTPAEFVGLGGNDDDPLFADDDGSRYVPDPATIIVLAIVGNVLQQLLIRHPHEPPQVFHWVPVIGSTISYGMDPYRFFFRCREEYGDIFTFVLLGRKTTVCLGTRGNDFILNGKLKDVNAEEIYTPLTTPVFGRDVVYDCPNAKLMEQKKFVKFGLTAEALRSYVPLIVGEVEGYIKNSGSFKGPKGLVDVPSAMSEITIFTASRSLQGKEVRDRLDSGFAKLYHDLDLGFTPINFMLPWAPLPQNRKRDYAHKKMAQTYMDIIRVRREEGGPRNSDDMIWNLMSSEYKSGRPVPDAEVAHMMIALLMAGQHSSSSTSAWIMLRLASRPDIMEELYEEQRRVLGPDLPPLTYDNLQRLPLHQNTLKETLRLHAPIHSILRKVKSPMPVDGTPYVIPVGRILLAAPGVSCQSAAHFPDPTRWDPHRWESVEGVDDSDDKIDYGYGLVSKGTNSPYLPFGAGRHRCIGEQFANVQLITILATLVREFRVKNVGGRTGVVSTDYSPSDDALRPADGHDDLAFVIRAVYGDHIYTANFTDPFTNGSLLGQVDLARLRKGKDGGTFWSAYVPCPANGTDFSDGVYTEAVRQTEEQLDLLDRLRAAYPDDFSPMPNSSTALGYFQRGQIISPFAIEGLHQIGNSFARLRLFYRLGARYATLTHNCHNAFADAALSEDPITRQTRVATPYWGGLSPRGRVLVQEMQRLGMMVDLSHVSQATMRHVLALSAQQHIPIIFSHSSAYALCPHPRNVPDDILRQTRDTDSLVMVNFAPDFISCLPLPPTADPNTTLPAPYPPNATLARVADHIQHIAAVTGSYRHVGLGSDFDGIMLGPAGLDDVAHFSALVVELLRRGVSERNCARILSGNVLRVWAAVERGAARLVAQGVRPVEDDVPTLF